MVNFRKKIWLYVTDTNGSVGLVHPLVIAFIVLLVVGHIAFACVGTTALFETNIVLASLAAVFLQEGLLGLCVAVLAFAVAGNTIVDRVGNVALLVLVAFALVLRAGWNVTFPGTLVFGFPSGLLLGYTTVRWPNLRFGGWLTDLEMPLWLVLLVTTLFSGVVLLIEHNGGPLEGHAHAASLVSLGAGLLLGGIHRLVSRSAPSATMLRR